MFVMKIKKKHSEIFSSKIESEKNKKVNNIDDKIAEREKIYSNLANQNRLINSSKMENIHSSINASTSLPLLMSKTEMQSL